MPGCGGWCDALLFTLFGRSIIFGFMGRAIRVWWWCLRSSRLLSMIIAGLGDVLTSWRVFLFPLEIGLLELVLWFFFHIYGFVGFHCLCCVCDFFLCALTSGFEVSHFWPNILLLSTKKKKNKKLSACQSI